MLAGQRVVIVSESLIYRSQPELKSRSLESEVGGNIGGRSRESESGWRLFRTIESGVGSREKKVSESGVGVKNSISGLLSPSLNQIVCSIARSLRI